MENKIKNVWRLQTDVKLIGWPHIHCLLPPIIGYCVQNRWVSDKLIKKNAG